MLSNLTRALNETVFSDDINISLDKIKIEENKLILSIIITTEYNDELLQVWNIRCEDFQDHKLDVCYFDDFEVLGNHVLLWKYHFNKAELYFKGKCSDLNSAIGDLYITHLNSVNGTIHLEKYLNINYYNSDVVLLFKNGDGLFSKGPVNLIKDYEQVLLRNGFSTSIIEFPKEKEPYKIFIFGDSYVVAKDFQAVQVFDFTKNLDQ